MNYKNNKSNYQNIRMPRSIGHNILLNKHTIKSSIALLDTKNKKLEESIRGADLRVLKGYPLAYDFFINMIERLKDVGFRGLTDGDDYYYLNVSQNTVNDYFSLVNGRTQRQSLKRQLYKQITSGWICYEKGMYTVTQVPFMYMKRIVNNNTGGIAHNFIILKELFKPLVESNSKGDGFVEIPKSLYPLATHHDYDEFPTANPLYRLNIHGLMKNTNNKKFVRIPTKELLTIIIPEYTKIRDAKPILKKSYSQIHSEIMNGIDSINKSSPPNTKMVKNLYMNDDFTTLYF